ncbi:unnamed protein product [Lactuca saligna]|uniref:Uncharacterized protein n=1 Tax=Lactuca saligna TaxID=75948 RepID=A0AA35VNF4_LACSI|nr:unnamed protein product [Lactuca saligna]
MLMKYDNQISQEKKAKYFQFLIQVFTSKVEESRSFLLQFNMSSLSEKFFLVTRMISGKTTSQLFCGSLVDFYVKEGPPSISMYNKGLLLLEPLNNPLVQTKQQLELLLLFPLDSNPIQKATSATKRAQDGNHSKVCSWFKRHSSCENIPREIIKQNGRFQKHGDGGSLFDERHLGKEKHENLCLCGYYSDRKRFLEDLVCEIVSEDVCQLF